MTPHIEAKTDDIAPVVIMPGDPKRAKMIAEKYLDNFVQVNEVRNMYAYTGTYKGTRITVMGSGMGIPSMGIYAYELYKFYDVEKIIRVGSCGSIARGLNYFDIVLSELVFTASNFALELSGEKSHLVEADAELNEKIRQVARTRDVKLLVGNTITSEVFDKYMVDKTIHHQFITEEFKPVAVEMEAFALFYVAKLLNKKAACLMTVVDLADDDHTTVISPEERENGLTSMIELALESATQ